MVTFAQLGRYGRLGNQMFQVASTIGIAKANGYEYAFPEWVNHDAAERFGSKEDVSVGEWFPNWKHVPRLDRELPDYHIPWGWHGLNHPDDVSLVGHMQSERYFAHCADYLRELFAMDDDKAKVPYTAVHVRMGDYGSSYHPICPYDYYGSAMHRMKGRFMVFSDEPERAWKMLKPLLGPDDVLFHGDTRQAFRRMKKCHAHIIANSTFSWWAAWLAGGEVIAPSEWFGPDAAHLDTLDIYPNSWTVI
jgi:hypothetical protein